jgi:hypothetical protein
VQRGEGTGNGTGKGREGKGSEGRRCEGEVKGIISITIWERKAKTAERRERSGSDTWAIRTRRFSFRYWSWCM